jgi:hypothetical protein
VLSAAHAAADERITTAHRAKLSYIYVRQSSLNQVKQHQESTELQYRLVDRATGLGWPSERVHVIDEDLGKSGAGCVERQGFQRLIAEIGLGNAGLVRFLRASGLPLPVRPLLGPSPHEVVWREADSARVHNILHNPAYAGAYVYGRRRRNPSRSRPGSVRGTFKVAVADWAV